MRCNRCVMDDSADPTIHFDQAGRCNYCTEALSKMEVSYFPNEEGQRRLQALLTQVKRAGRGREYDCMMGISGGLDSSYLAYLGHQWGLRILGVHIDDGFDTEISKENIARLEKATGMTLIRVAPDAKQFYGLTKAYMKAGVANLAVPQDSVLFASLYRCMKQYRVKYFFSGTNFALESITQKGNTHPMLDLTNIRDINRKYGDGPVDKLPFLTSPKKAMDTLLYGIRTVKPLDDIDYNRDRAFAELKDFCGFAYYGRKHLENVLTGFIQTYWFPKKFGVDKRTSHLSSMIVSGQMSRDEALRELSEPLYDEKQMEEWIGIIKRTIGITDEEFDEIMAAPTHRHTDFAVSALERLRPAMSRVKNRLLHAGK